VSGKSHVIQRTSTRAGSRPEPRRHIVAVAADASSAAALTRALRGGAHPGFARRTTPLTGNLAAVRPASDSLQNPVIPEPAPACRRWNPESSVFWRANQRHWIPGSAPMKLPAAPQ
jgi:hypothetical protein